MKYTTARALAEQAVTLAMAQLGRHAPPKTATLRLPGREPDGSSRPPASIDRRGTTCSASTATDAARVAAVVLTSPLLGERLDPRLPIVGAQVVEAARNEMALTLEDIVLRRTGLGSAGYPGDEVILRVERIARDELAWSSSRVQDEIQGLKEFYLPIRV